MNHQIFIELYTWFFEHIQFDNYTLDKDSSAITRYGEQEAKKSTTPRSLAVAAIIPCLLLSMTYAWWPIAGTAAAIQGATATASIF